MWVQEDCFEHVILAHTHEMDTSAGCVTLRCRVRAYVCVRMGRLPGCLLGLAQVDRLMSSPHRKATQYGTIRHGSKR